MKKLCFLILTMSVFFNFSMAQWSADGNSFTSGRVGIGTTTVSADYDIEISRNGATAGVKVFNNLSTGRSIFLFGEGFGGRYGYAAYHGQNHDAGSGYTQSLRPRSTVFVGGDVGGLGILSAGEIRFATGGFSDANQKMVINSSGNVGIGFSSPDAKLQIAGSIFSNATRTNSIFTGSVSADNANLIGSEGYWALRTAANNSYNLDVYNGGGANVMAAMTVLQNGNVGIGSAAPDTKLTVKGVIHTSEVRVDMTVPGPDYVFEKDYNLLPLSELETYITQNKHLPEVPSAREMEADGLNLKEMNLILLKKVEELTLHLIKQEKEIETLKQKVYEKN